MVGHDGDELLGPLDHCRDHRARPIIGPRTEHVRAHQVGGLTRLRVAFALPLVLIAGALEFQAARAWLPG